MMIFQVGLFTKLAFGNCFMQHDLRFKVVCLLYAQIPKEPVTPRDPLVRFNVWRHSKISMHFSIVANKVSIGSEVWKPSKP